MQFAILHNERIEAYKTGLIATCPVCGENVRAKCGQIRLHHWAHITKQDCDPWKEAETEWHRRWKERFPKEWREVVIVEVVDEHTHIKHRADIRTDKGLTIEFQNSPISLDEVRQREHFYKNLIWVVNAQKFQEHFGIQSQVLQKLKRVERKYKRQIEAINKTFGETPFGREIEEQTQQINEKEVELQEQQGKLCWIETQLEECQKY